MTFLGTRSSYWYQDICSCDLDHLVNWPFSGAFLFHTHILFIDILLSFTKKLLCPYCMHTYNTGVIELILVNIGPSCKNARACECFLKPTIANIHQYQFKNSLIIELYFSVNICEFSVQFISDSYAEWWYCISRESVQYRQSHSSPVQHATVYMIRFYEKYEQLWLIG